MNLSQLVSLSRSVRTVAVAGSLVAVLLGGCAPTRERDRLAEQQSAIDHLRAMQPEARRTRVLVLGTFHLRQVAESFRQEMLDPLLAVLEEFRPDAICVEVMPGSLVHELELRRDAGPLHGDVLDGFAATHLKLGHLAHAALRTKPPQASIEVRELLSRSSAAGRRERTPDERATAALWMLAAYDPSSAILQWSYLSEEERRGQTAIPPGLAAELDRELAEVNEVPAVAVRLARRRGLETLSPVDDFEDLDAFAAIMPQLEEDFADNPLLASVSKATVYEDAAARLKECVSGGDLLPQLILLNSPGYARADVEAQWGVFLRTRFESGTDRVRLGLWENRNLKIAARIRSVAALHPGGRVLVIYGAAHKPFLEAYLARTADLELVDFVTHAQAAGAGAAGDRS